MDAMAGSSKADVIVVRSRKQADLVDVTVEVEARVRQTGIDRGICHVYVAHTTAGIAINENADPGVLEDLLTTLDRLVPWEHGYRHLEDNAAAHIKATLIGASQTIPVREGRLALGRWQAIYLAEFDGPRERRLHVTVTRA
jgi:secondary thiamine-phosphate synthase enzyme